MKRNWILAMFVLFTVAAASAQTAADFTINENGAITAYSGFDTDITIPAAIGGKAVTAIGDSAFLKAELTSVVIPQSVTRIGANAFEGNKLTAVTIPNSVTFIGKEAFKGNQLTSITIPGSVKEIHWDAFVNNTALAAIVLEEGVETVGSGAFSNTNCKSVTIPSTILFLNLDAFDIRGRPSFTIAANGIPENILVTGYGSNFRNLPDAIFYNYIANGRKAGTYTLDMPAVRKTADDHDYIETQFGAVLVGYEGNSTRIRVPAEIGGVAVTALYETYSRKSITALQIPESVTYIGGNTFAGNQLTSITIPGSVTFIGNAAFNSNSLPSVTIPDSAIVIGNNAFSKNKLESVTIGNSVLIIGKEAFRENPLTSVAIPNSVTYIADSAFNGVALTRLTLGNSVKYIGNSAFYGNVFTSLTIPNSVTYIGSLAFPNILTSITIGANVDIQNNCHDLHSVYNNGGKRAGTYTRPDHYVGSKWTRR